MAAYKMYDFEDYTSNDNLAVKKLAEPNRKILKKTIKKNKVYLVPVVLIVFAMTLIITSRYTIINEKNLESIKLKDDLEKAEATLFSTKISVEQNTDLNEIEAYAKQQLGMQKPTKNQITYIDTSENIGTVEIIKSNSIIDNIKDNVSNLIKNIF